MSSAEIGSMDQLGSDGLPLGNIFPLRIFDDIATSRTKSPDWTMLKKLLTSRPLMLIPDGGKYEQKTEEEYENYHLDLADLAETLKIDVHKDLPVTGGFLSKLKLITGCDCWCRL